ncbi:MAG: hypothetical protein M4579_002881 [Chaenotheca gracillima]|nr:MAG: hypothetical protein M4579_002881 [Chaenotheca gracillima]
MPESTHEGGSKKRRHRHDRETDPERSHRSKKKRRKDEVHDEPHSESKPPPSVTDIKPSSQNEAQPASLKPQDSPFYQQTSSLYLPLSPISQATALEGLCAEHISPLILTYYPPFRGVILSFNNPRLSESPHNYDQSSGHALAKSIDEYAASFVWVTADFLLFKPKKDQWLEGWVNLQNEDHLGLVCWNLFNASIERKRLPQTWQWVDIGNNSMNGSKTDESHHEPTTNGVEEGGGYFQDEDGAMIDGLIRFRVKDIETFFGREKGFLGLEGTMLEQEDEQKLLEREHESLRLS